MAFVTARDGQKLYVRVLGRGQPVLLLHGLGMKSAHWLPFVWPLRRQFSFYMPDFRGAGRSAAATFNQADVFQNHMEDVQDMVAALDLNDLLLVGYSLGATTSLHWQNAGGFDRVKAYLHIDQSPCVGNRADWPYGLFGRQQEWVFARLNRLLTLLEDSKAVQLGELPEKSRQELARVLGDVFVKLLGKQSVKAVFVLAARFPLLLPALLPVTRAADLRAYLTGYTRLGHDYLPRLAGETTPITVLIGGRSPLYAEAGQRAVAETVANGKVVMLEKSGHVPLLDQPLAFACELRRFLRESS